MLTEAYENYLRSILAISIKKGQVHSVDVAADRGVSRPSVSAAMKELKNGGYITKDRSGRLGLTEKGRAIASEILKRYDFMYRWLVEKGIAEDMANEAACRLEHVIDDDFIRKIGSDSRD